MKLPLGLLASTGYLLLGCATEPVGSSDDNAPGSADNDGDGVADGLGTVVDGGIDINGDGIADGVGVDTDGDGIIDGVDTDGDGIPDVVVSNGTGGASGSGGAGSGGTASTGGAAATGGGGAVDECVPVTDRCDCVVSADGVSNVIDTFEDGDMRINVVDARDGEWFQAKGRISAAPLGTITVAEGALHLTGGPTTLSPAQGEADDWATFGVPLGQCYNASVYAGLKFRIKGSTAGNDSVRFSISTPPTTEVAAGGGCPDGDLGCYNHFGKTIILTNDWQEVTATWAELQQSPNWGIKAPTNYDKASHIMAVNFAPMLNTEAYDFWIDDLQFTTTGGGDCSDTITSALFDQLFPKRNAFYTYAGFVAATKQFPAFCNEGAADAKKRDAAAFFGQTVQETGADVADPTTALFHIEEIDKSNSYCDAARTEFPCSGQYYGRGPMQLTWNYNYGTAGLALGLPFLTNPGLVSSSSENAFKAALWFWMTRQPVKSPHTVMVLNEGYAETTRMVNGPLECDGKRPAATANRARAYEHFASILGIDPGDNLDCN